MGIIKNSLKQRLQAGQLCLGFGLGKLRTADIAMLARSCDYDWLFIDMEHTTLDYDQAGQICVAALDTGVTPIVRTISQQYFHLTRLLDAGAQGVIVPHVDTAEQARAVVSACRYPPLGERSLYGVLPQLDYRPVPADQAIPSLNEQTLVVVMIESPEAVANADAIAAVPGVDGLLIGTSDLTASAGIPGQLDHPDIVQAYETVITACQQHGKFPGMGGVYQNELAARYIAMGMQMILVGSDVAFMQAGARQRSEFLRGL